MSARTRRALELSGSLSGSLNIALSVALRATLLCALCLAAVCTHARAAPALQQPASRDETAGAQPSATRDATLARWRESLELDLAGPVLAREGALVATGGALAHDGEALALFARMLSSVGEDERARELLERAQVDAPTRAWVDLGRARLALDRDELTRVLELLRAAPGSAELVRHPQLPECWLLVGRASARALDTATARTALKRFVELAPLDSEAPAAWHMLAQAALSAGDLKDAEACKQNAQKSSEWQAYYRTRRLQVRAQPTEPLPRLGLAQLWMAAGEFARARDVLLTLLELAPDFCRALELLGEAERKLVHDERARAAYDRALACDPALDEARFNRGMLALSERREQDARADFEWIVEHPAGRDPRFVRAHLELARLLLASDAEGAQKRYAEYARLGGKEALRRE